ncbi:serine hydrolase domain-containing protein [Flagellimonas profundi]|uniref:Serine hydrolase n=1 Tax=Flagellimonas profundi TaxID=2915620 RepID=A0ABS3FD15_9FLAO|nr:serine hydrolase domain-containing protein [Allomuricauda profundi]MBO0341055.1 serine hydrolase [Allomuricauda profundi]
MKKLIVLFILFNLFGCINSGPQIKRIDDSQISKSELTAKIKSLVDSANVTGISIAIFNNNKITYQNSFGYANINNKDTLTNQTVFYGASLSKAVFGYLVAQLVTEGILDLDKPLQDYLDKPLPTIEFEKEWRGYKNLKKDKRYEKITARMCLSHTTGFPNWRWMTKENDFFREGKIRFTVEPGTRYSYSGEGIQLLQFVIEQITGQELEKLAQELIFHPLQMNMTSYVWQDKFNNKYCNGHTTEEKIIPIDKEDEANAAGSLSTTLEDYSKLIKHILEQTSHNLPITDLLFRPNIRIKSKTQFGHQAWEDTNENDSIELSYGLGWGLLTSPYGKGAFKEGHGEGYQHYSIIFPEKNIGIIILSNSDNAESIFKELLEISIRDTYTPWKWESYIPYNYEQK